jgi:hypothetical protein
MFLNEAFYNVRGGNPDSSIKKYGVKIDTVFMDWTSMYFEDLRKESSVLGIPGTERQIFRRSQSVNRLTANRGCMSDSPFSENILYKTHFKDTFKQIYLPLSKDAMIVFDNGAHTGKCENVGLKRSGICYETAIEQNR